MNGRPMLRRAIGTAALAALLVWLGGCAMGPRWPAITDSPVAGQHTPGRWIWAELVTTDVERARRFYGAVFGWEYQTFGEAPRRYTLATVNGAPVAGILARPASQDRPARWIGVMSVADVAATVEASEAAGGRVAVEPSRVNGRGRAALLVDAGGSLFAVLKTDDGDPPDRLPEVGHWFWHERWTNDGRQAADFYAALDAASVIPVPHDDGYLEWHLEAGGYPRAGIVQPEKPLVEEAWLHYVRVADLEQAVGRALAADGRVLLAPSPDVRDGRIAIVVDPLGAAVGLVEWDEPGLAEVMP